MDSERKKRREAALKAWQTIRQRQRENRSKGIEKITNFFEVKKIGKIRHPEDISEDFNERWSGNGVIKLFKKTPEARARIR